MYKTLDVFKCEKSEKVIAEPKDLSRMRSRCENMTCDNNDSLERLLKCEEELEYCKNDLQTWTDALEDFSEIEDAFEADGRIRLKGKTILDVGTDCVKPLYIALKFEPSKVIGISENLSGYSFASDLKRKLELVTKTKVRLFRCNFFDTEGFDKILKKEKIGKFDFVLVSKTLHHLRTGKCIARERDRKHDCEKDETEKNCIYKFEEGETFKRLLESGKKVLVYEWFDPNETDEDKVRGRGGYFTIKEWMRIFEYLSRKYEVEFIRPERFHLNKEALDRVCSILRQVDCVCFVVERKTI